MDPLLVSRLVKKLKMANLIDSFTSPESDICRSVDESGYFSSCTPSSSFGSCSYRLSFSYASSSEDRPSRSCARKRNKNGTIIFPSCNATNNRHLDPLELLTCQGLLDNLLQYLSPVDLIQCSMVSWHWNRILKNNRIAVEKMKLTTPHGSENLLVPFEVAESRRQHRHFGTPLNSRVPFRQPDFSSPSPLPVSPSKISRIDRFEAFRLMGNGLLSGEAQLSCPLCDLPARKEGNKTVGVCTNCQCRFRFCQNCRGEEHGMSQCRLLLTPEKLIGARLASRKHYLKNMKRLNLS